MEIPSFWLAPEPAAGKFQTKKAAPCGTAPIKKPKIFSLFFLPA